MAVSIVWFRRDLRRQDNRALRIAAENGPVIPLFVLDEADRTEGGASKWWLHHSLKALEADLGGLVIQRGDPAEILEQLVDQTGASAVYWNRQYDPHSVARDTRIKTILNGKNVLAESFPGSVVREPWEVKTGSGGPFKVYTPFWKANLAQGIPDVDDTSTPELSKLAGLGISIDQLDLLPTKPDWAAGWDQLWTPGENGAHKRLETFLNFGLEGYAELRNRPDRENVSRLSPHLHFGEISPRQVCKRAMAHAMATGKNTGDADKFIAEIGWRDFSNHLLFHFPTIATENWKPAFDVYPWREDEALLRAWQQGMTGYPMVDSGMRELWHTGYMHNRVRMLVGSFLVKHLQIHWKHGEAWFWDTLLDADLANNTASWQWITGSGADAAPYFRIFNPISQGPKFDPNGDYVRKWCPELSKLENKYIHAPFEAPEPLLTSAGIKLGKDYPYPIVDHAAARKRALEGYEAVKLAG